MGVALFPEDPVWQKTRFETLLKDGQGLRAILAAGLFASDSYCPEQKHLEWAMGLNNRIDSTDGPEGAHLDIWSRTLDEMTDDDITQ